MIIFKFFEYRNFALLLMPIQKFSAAFWSLSNFRNFSLVNGKLMAKDQKVNNAVTYTCKLQV